VDHVARHLIVGGQVQGVFFRASTRRQAEQRAVVGWVANRPDGTVEAWLEGAPDDVRAVEDWIVAGGPPAARVADVQRADAEPVGHRRFEVRSG
jgi:acylphosphatase